MADEILPNTGMELPDVGLDEDSWGDLLNANMRILDNAITLGRVTKTLGAVDVTLTAAEAAKGIIDLSGTLTANVAVIVPTSTVRLYLVKNGTTGAFSVTVKTAAGTGITVAQGYNTLLYSDTTNVVQGATSLGGTFSGANATLSGTLGVTGATTLAATSVTTLSASGAATLAAASATNLSYSGTLTGSTGVINIGSGQIYKDANGVVGIGVVPSSFTAASTKVLQVATAALSSNTASAYLTSNVNRTSGGDLYIASAFASAVEFNNAGTGGIQFRVAPSGIAGNAIAFTQAINLDASGNLGVGVTPSPHVSANYGGPMLQIGGQGSILGSSVDTELCSNVYYASGFWRYIGTGVATSYRQTVGAHSWRSAPSGTAGNAITFTDTLTLTQAGNLLVGTTTASDARFKVTPTSTADRYGAYIAGTYAGGSGVSGSVYGAYIQGFSTNSSTTLYGIYADTPAALGQAAYGGYFKSAGSASSNTYGSFSESTQTDTNGPAVAYGAYGKVSSAGTNLAGSHWAGYFENSGATGLVANGLGVSTVSGAATVYGIRYQHAGVVNFQVLSSGNVQNTSNSYGAISDVKLKENITDAPGYLQKFMQVRFRKYNLIGSDFTQLGVIAQELEEVFPGLVDSTPDVQAVEVIDAKTGETRTELRGVGTFTKSVKYSVLAQIQGKVIQEQQAIIQDLLQRVAALEAK